MSCKCLCLYEWLWTPHSCKLHSCKLFVLGLYWCDVNVVLLKWGRSTLSVACYYKVRRVGLLVKLHRTATGGSLSIWDHTVLPVTQHKCTPLHGVSLSIWDHTVLPATRHKRTPHLNPCQRSVLDLLTLEGWKAELILVTGYLPRCFTHTQIVTHLSTNPAVSRICSLLITSLSVSKVNLCGTFS